MSQVVLVGWGGKKGGDTWWLRYEDNADIVLLLPPLFQIVPSNEQHVGKCPVAFLTLIKYAWDTTFLTSMSRSCLQSLRSFCMFLLHDLQQITNRGSPAERSRIPGAGRSS